MTLRLNDFDSHAEWSSPDARRFTFTFISLFILLIIIYGNSFNCEWHFDDFPNIVDNKYVHLETLSWKNIKKAFYGSPDGHDKVTRPLSYLSLALNYYIGGTRVFGYHVVNFIIHAITSVFLFLFIYRTLKLPLLKDRYEKSAYSVALLSVFFWASHPVQVTAVTYIVQRMASMAAMFYIMAMVFYLKGRISANRRAQVVFFSLAGISTVLSFSSKQNAAMLPLSLFVYEIILIQGATTENIRKGLKMGILLVLLVLIVAIIVHLDFFSFMEGYGYRPFTLTERLLTEPRVILLYITLLFYPTSSRLSFLHDIAVSRSLFVPWTTFPAIGLVLLFIVTALWASRKRPLIAFCFLFFFLNHLIEGSVFPLELVFEHRNYLPSALLFVPVALFALYVLDYFSYRRSIWICVFGVMVLLLASQAHTTYLRNKVLKTEISLWQDVVEKAPGLSRPYINLSNALFAAGRNTEGLSMLNKAIGSKPGPNPRSHALPAHNLGQYYLAIGEIDRALELFNEALASDPSISQAYHGIGKVMFFKGALKEAEQNIRKALSLDPASALYTRTLSIILLRDGRVDDAMKQAVRARQLDDTLPEPLYVLGEAYRIKKKWHRAAHYFEKFLESRPGNLDARMALIEIYDTMGEKSLAKQHIFALMAEKGQREFLDVLLDFDEQMNFLGHDRADAVLGVVKAGLREEALGLETIGTLVHQTQGKNSWRQPLLQGETPLLQIPEP
jgi:tetratricopeptide (TPR) repeat protein